MGALYSHPQDRMRIYQDPIPLRMIVEQRLVVLVLFFIRALGGDGGTPQSLSVISLNWSFTIGHRAQDALLESLADWKCQGEYKPDLFRTRDAISESKLVRRRKSKDSLEGSSNQEISEFLQRGRRKLKRKPKISLTLLS